MLSKLTVIQDLQALQTDFDRTGIEKTHISYIALVDALKHLRQSRSLIKKLTNPLPEYTDERADLIISSESV
jgi:hypothetical protein